MLYRLFGLLIFVLASALAYLTFDQFKGEIRWMTATPAERISIIVENDFKSLVQSKDLPPEWADLTEVVYKMNSPVTQALMGNERPHLELASLSPNYKKQKNKKEKEEAKNYEAEIEVIDLPDEQKPGFIFQVSLIDMKSKNKIFEIGRTYYFNELNKKKPD
jgi:hypothetical protein